MGRILLGFLIFLTAACAPFTTAAPLPTPQAVRVSLPPALRPWSSRLQACAAKDPGLALFIDEIASNSQAQGQADLAFHLGAPANPASAYLAQVGSEDIAIFVNVNNAFDQLSQVQLMDLFSGNVTRWESLSAASGKFVGEVKVWTYPLSDELRLALESALFQGNKSRAQAMLAPDPQAMLEAVAADENAIGYAPLSWLKTAAPELVNKLKQIKLDSALSKALHRPILAGATAEPQGAARALLVCLEQK